MKALRHILELSQLSLPFPLSTLYGILGHLPDQALFQLEETPVFHHSLVSAIQADQQEIRQNGQCDRACYALLGVGHLHSAQVQTALQLFYGEFHPPPSRVYTENGARRCPREIGHDDFYLFRPSVTPFLGEYQRDIAQLMQRGVAHKHPVILPPAIRFSAGSAVVIALRQVLDQVPEVFAIGELPGAGHRKHIAIVLFGYQTQSRIGRKARISNNHDVACPAWGYKILQHLSEQDVLVPFDLWVNERQGNWDTKAVPTGNHQHHLKAKGIGFVLAVARRVSQGMFPPTLLFQRTIPNDIQDPVRWGRQRPQGGRRHLRHHRYGIPLARPDHTQSRPIGKLQRQIGPKSLK